MTHLQTFVVLNAGVYSTTAVGLALGFEFQVNLFDPMFWSGITLLAHKACSKEPDQ